MAEHTSWTTPGVGQLGRPGAAARLVRGLDDEHRPPGLRQGDGGDQTVRARSDDDGVDLDVVTSGAVHHGVVSRAGRRTPAGCCRGRGS